MHFRLFYLIPFLFYDRPLVRVSFISCPIINISVTFYLSRLIFIKNHHPVSNGKATRRDVTVDNVYRPDVELWDDNMDPILLYQTSISQTKCQRLSTFDLSHYLTDGVSGAR